MAGKSIFTDEQRDILRSTARRIWHEKFKKEGKTQEQFGLALGLTQQSISGVIRGEYTPGLKAARALAVLDGTTLEQLIGEVGTPEPAAPHASAGNLSPSPFKNLDVCIDFHATSKHWSPWTVAAARAGFFGNSDFAPPEWAGKLDLLERALDRARKGTK